MRLSALLLVGVFSFVHLAASAFAAQQPVTSEIIPLDELKPGMQGEVWTVFQGTEPEPFTVEVTGVIRNALGPGKSLLLCRLTDPRVQHMGAVAGMSGSPLYIDGRLAGALSYQIQRFETVRHAGFTPAADLIEVQEKVQKNTDAAALPSTSVKPVSNPPLTSLGTDSSFHPLRPVFSLSGLSPVVAELLSPHFSALGLTTTSLGGSTGSGHESLPKVAELRPGQAVGVALATGDITLADTGTVSQVDGNRITAFGHPMLGLGEVELPMCAAEIITILPSNLSSFKIANTGGVIGTIAQDRLSAIAGTLGAGPTMTPVEVVVSPNGGPERALKFSVVRHAQLTAPLVAAGVAQAILGSNDAGLSEGFRLSSDVAFAEGQALANKTIYAGPQAFAQGLGEFVQRLAANLQNPYAKTFPDKVTFTVEPLEQNPAIVLESLQLSRSTARAGESVEATLSWRDWQGEAHREIATFTVDPSWTGKNLDVVLMSGRAFDELTGRPRKIPAAQLRSFDAYLAALRDDRRPDGLYLAVVEKSSLFSDQSTPTLDLPGSLERIARAADEARYQKREVAAPLWEKHLLPGKLTTVQVLRPLQVVE